MTDFPSGETSSSMFGSEWNVICLGGDDLSSGMEKICMLPSLFVLK